MYLQVPTEEQQEEARTDVGSTKETVKRDVEHLIEWFRKQPHLPNYDDYHALSHVLLNCKNSLEKAKSRLESYFYLRTSMPEIFNHRDPCDLELEKCAKLGMYVPLPKLTPEGYRVTMLYISDEATTIQEIPSASLFLKLTLMTVDLMGKMDYPKGVIAIHDGKNMTMRFVTMFSSEMNKLFLLTIKTVPTRYRKFYCVNTNKPQDLLISLSKSLMKKQMAERIEVLKDKADLLKVIPKEILPRDYGGDELPLSELRDCWYEEMKRHKDFFVLSEQHKMDKSKMPGKENFESTLNGVAGSFRQISVD